MLETDTLFNIENLVFTNGALDAQNPVWVIEDGLLVATFTSVGDAVGFANTLGGSVVDVEIGHGTTPPASYAEGAIDVTRAMTIKGFGGTASIQATDGVNLFTVADSISGTVRFEALALSDDGVGATADYGIRFTGSHGSNSSTDLELDNVSISGFEQTGLYVNGGGTTLDVTITGSQFTGNGGNGSSGGTGDVLFFEFTGDATLTNVTVTGTTGTSAGSADHGIQFAGFNDTTDAIADAIGSVVLNNVTVTGSYEKTLVYIQGYNNLSGVSFIGTQIGDAASTTTWTGLFVEPVSTGGTFTPSGSTSSLDLSNVTFAGTYGWQTLFQLPGANLILGEPTDDVFTGSAFNDAVRSFGGDDIINTGAGDDLVVYDVLTGGEDTVNGGTETVGGSDTVAIVGTNATETYDITATTGDNPIHVDVNTGNAVELTEIEDIVVQTNGGGDTVNITGDFGDTDLNVSTITVQGGAGGDTVDASLLESEHGIVFNGGGGDDTFISSNAGGNDTFNGGTDGPNGDTVDYSAVTGGGVTVDLVRHGRQQRHRCRQRHAHRRRARDRHRAGRQHHRRRRCQRAHGQWRRRYLVWPRRRGHADRRVRD